MERDIKERYREYVVTLYYTDHEKELKQQCFGTMTEINIEKRWGRGIIAAIRLLDVDNIYGFTVGDPSIGDTINIKRTF